METEYIQDLFEPFGPVIVKRMFGGAGIYHQGEIIAVIVDGEVCLKADATSAPEFAAAGSTQWTYEGRNRGTYEGRNRRTYEGKNRPVKMPYWRLPETALDDPDEMTAWAKLAYAAALRSKMLKKKKKKT